MKYVVIVEICYMVRFILKQYEDEKMITITKVVTRNFIMDIVANIQNMLGMNLVSYEKMIDKAIGQIMKDLEERKIKLKWYRYEMNQLTNGAMAILFYGDEK